MNSKCQSKLDNFLTILYVLGKVQEAVSTRSGYLRHTKLLRNVSSVL